MEQSTGQKWKSQYINRMRKIIWFSFCSLLFIVLWIVNRKCLKYRNSFRMNAHNAMNGILYCCCNRNRLTVEFQQLNCSIFGRKTLIAQIPFLQQHFRPHSFVTFSHNYATDSDIFRSTTILCIQQSTPNDNI